MVCGGAHVLRHVCVCVCAVPSSNMAMCMRGTLIGGGCWCWPFAIMIIVLRRYMHTRLFHACNDARACECAARSHSKPGVAMNRKPERRTASYNSAHCVRRACGTIRIIYSPLLCALHVVHLIGVHMCSSRVRFHAATAKGCRHTRGQRLHPAPTRSNNTQTQTEAHVLQAYTRVRLIRNARAHE